MKYKHIVFDIDGTLIDTEYAVLHSLQETIKGLSGREEGLAYVCELTPDKVREYRGDPQAPAKSP